MLDKILSQKPVNIGSNVLIVLMIYILLLFLFYLSTGEYGGNVTGLCNDKYTVGAYNYTHTATYTYIER